MRILAMVHLFPPRHCAGAEMMLVTMLRALVGRGHTVNAVLSFPTADSGPYDYHGITVHPRRDEADVFRFLPDTDLIVTHLENTPRALVLGQMHDIPVVIIEHNDKDLSRTWASPHAACVVLNSEWMCEAFGRPANGMIVRPPVIASDYRTTPGHKVTLINLCEEKGGHLFAKLAEVMPDTQFLAVKGAYNRQIVPGLPNVEVREHGGDMRAVYHSTRILLIPSVYESWGRVGVEAMVSGIPVIAHPTPGLRESLGFAGVFCDRDDPSAWVDAIRRMQDPARWDEQSVLAERRAAELDPAPDLARWIARVEQIGGGDGRLSA